MTGFFEELKRRKVYRVAIAYAVMSWALAQGLAQVLPVFEISNSAIRVVIALLLIGFPVALVLAWVFDITPEGIRATPAPTVPKTRRSRNLIMLIAIGVIVSAVAGFFFLPRVSARKIDKSIAVLPFQNLSDEKENAYFADGIQDDILTNLSKIGDLKVISRTSVNSYRDSAARNAREIGKALGVATLLEGSVRRIGNRVRVNVQLINADDDEHIWAEDYDRDLTDVFAIQTDLAQKIASALQAKLSPNEKKWLDRRPTENSDAYWLYVQAHDYATQMDIFHQTSLKAVPLFEQAIKIDPNFALAFAGLSMAESWIYHSIDPTASWRDKARLHADEALRLQPDLPEGHLALGHSYYYGDRNYERALAELELAKQGLPNDAQVYLAIGAIQRRQGKWTESTANLEKAVALDPKDANTLTNLASNYIALRNFEAADKTIDRAIAIAPQSSEIAGFKGYVAILWKGDLRMAERQYSSIPSDSDPTGVMAWMRSGVLMWERRFPEALALLQKFPGETLATITTAPMPKSLLEASIYAIQGDQQTAQTKFEHALEISEQLLRDAPDDAARHAQHGFILAGLGRKQEAIAEGKRAIELLPESQDAFDGPRCTASLAQIYSLTGQADEAFRLIDHLLSVPNGLTIPLLKLDPIWDPLRKDRRFQALMEKYAANH